MANRLFNWFSKRARSNSPNDPLWKSFSGLRSTETGINVTDEKALQVSAVYACIRVLGESIASLPLKLYRRTPDGKKEAVNHPLYSILHDAPNDIQTSYEFRETMMAHLNIRGNFYALKEYDNMSVLSGFSILSPERVKVLTEGGRIYYEFTTEDGEKSVFTSDEIWHVRSLSTDGVVGLSPITQARESIGLSIATEAHGSRLFKNDAKPGGLLVSPGVLKEDARERLKNGWQAAYTGSNAWKVAVLEGGMEYKPIGFSNEDSQFLETRNFQVEDIARIFRVPSVMIGHPDKTSTYASAEQFFQSFVIHTIRPWATRIEQSINRFLLSDKERRKYFAEFNLDAIVRGDITSRYEAYASAIQNKWMSANEVREKENMNRIEGGDVYENPNITPGGMGG